MALSSVRTRVVCSGVEGTTMDFCRENTSEELCKRAPAQEADAVCRRTYVDPGVVHEQCDGHSLVGVCLQEPVDQVFG